MNEQPPIIEQTPINETPVRKKKKSPILRYVLAVVFSGGALYLAFRKQNFHLLREELLGVNVFIILCGTAVMFCSHFVRSWRYKMLLRPMKPDASIWSAFRALLAGYAMNNVIPRSGDIVRPVLFSKREHLPISSTVAAMLIERLSDLIGLSLLLMTSLIIFHSEIEIAFPAISAATIPILAVLAVILTLALMILFSEKKTSKVIHMLTRKLPDKIRIPIENATVAVAEGLKGAREGTALPLILTTFGISLLYTLSMYVSLFAFRGTQLSTVGIKGCILLITMSGLAFTIPTPGGTGTYHFFISQVLGAVFGIPPEVSIAYATVTHASNYLLTTITGMSFMFSDGISFTKLGTEDVKEALKVAPKPPLPGERLHVSTLP